MRLKWKLGVFFCAVFLTCLEPVLLRRGRQHPTPRLQVPAQQDLRRRLPVLGGRGLDYSVDRAARELGEGCEGCVRGDGDGMLGAPGEEGRLLQVRVGLHLARCTAAK